MPNAQNEWNETTGLYNIRSDFNFSFYFSLSSNAHSTLVGFDYDSLEGKKNKKGKIQHFMRFNGMKRHQTQVTQLGHRRAPRDREREDIGYKRNK